MIQAEKIIEIGKYKIDVSNISVKRKRIAVKDWNTLFNIKQDKDGTAMRDSKGNVQLVDKPRIFTEKQASRGVLNIGLYLARQDFKILNRRFKFTDAVKEFFKRYFISVRYIESLTPEELNIFVEWIYEYITGTKKKVMDLMFPMIQEMEKITEGMSDKETSDLALYLVSFFSEQVKQFQNLKVGVKKA